MDAHIFRIVNTYGRLRELGPEVDWKYYHHHHIFAQKDNIHQ